jgi:hypothetical protein
MYNLKSNSKKEFQLMMESQSIGMMIRALMEPIRDFFLLSETST